jgi:hypothetical protein
LYDVKRLAVRFDVANRSILGAFAKLRKATISFVMPICTFVRKDELGFHWTDFHVIFIRVFFEKSIEKIQVSLKSHKNNGYCT